MKTYLTNPKRKKTILYVCLDVVLIFSIFIFSYTFRIVFIDNESLIVLPSRISWIVVPGVLIHLVCFYIFGLYDFKKNINQRLLFVMVFFAVLFASMGVGLLSYVFPGEKIGRILNFIHIIFMGAAIYSSRIVYARSDIHGKEKNLIIIGWNPLVKKISKVLQKPDYGYHLKMIIVPEGYERPENINNPVPVYSSIDLGLQTQDLQVVVVSKQMKELEGFKKKMIDMRFQGLDIFMAPTFYEHILGKIPVSEISQDWLLFKSQIDSFQPNIYLKFKRVFDVLVSILALTLSMPIMLLVTFLIKLDSKGPVLFKQQRLGQYEVSFFLLKFRTMKDDAEKETGPCWAEKNDHRFTRMGNFLRKSRLDEFPQFINVLKGDMSIIGPRPIRQHFADIFAEDFPFYRLRFKVKPGITGWAQANMAYVNSVEDQYEKLEYEFYYLYHQSIFLDFFILLKTIQSIFKMRGG